MFVRTTRLRMISIPRYRETSIWSKFSGSSIRNVTGRPKSLHPHWSPGPGVAVQAERHGPSWALARRPSISPAAPRRAPYPQCSIATSGRRRAPARTIGILPSQLRVQSLAVFRGVRAPPIPSLPLLTMCIGRRGWPSEI